MYQTKTLSKAERAERNYAQVLAEITLDFTYRALSWQNAQGDNGEHTTAYTNVAQVLISAIPAHLQDEMNQMIYSQEYRFHYDI